MSLSTRQKERQSLKGTIEAFDRVVHKYDASTLPSVIQTAFDEVMDFNEQLKELHTKITHKTNTDEEIDDATAANIENRKMLLAMRIKLNSLVSPPTTSSSGNRSSIPSLHHFKLDRIRLPTFSGKFIEWEEFKDLFDSAVDSNMSLSKAEKMVYLKTHLTGDALSIVSSFPVTGASYDTAIELVKKRFANPREIAFSHLKKLYELPKAQDSSLDIRRVVDLINEVFRSFTNLKIPVNTWDVILVFWTLKKLDEETRKEWLLTQGCALPILKNLLRFLEKRATALDYSLTTSKSKSSQKSSTPKSAHSTSAEQTVTSASHPKCPDCKLAHNLRHCENFQKKPIPERNDFVKKTHLCFNCLSTGHSQSNCSSKWSCGHCQKLHHTLLHSISPVKVSVTPSQSSSDPPQQSKSETAVGTSTNCSFGNVSSSHILLETAVVKVGHHFVRLFIDKGSEAEFISEDCVRRLGLKKFGSPIRVTGLGGVDCGMTLGKVKVTLLSIISNFSLPICAEIVKKVTRGHLPQSFGQSKFHHLSGLNLADPEYFRPQDVDVLIGARYASLIKLGGIIHGPPGTPSAEETHFGWVISGLSPTSQKFTGQTSLKSHTTAVDPAYTVLSKNKQTTEPDECSLNRALSKFWETEEAEIHTLPRSIEDSICETIFTTTTTKNSEGRYVVALPFKKEHLPLGNSLSIATKRFHALERRMKKNPETRTFYENYFAEHLEAEVMEPIPLTQISLPSSQHYYMLYKEVIKESSSTTKIRTVYDCSSKTANGPSLNDILYSGPKVIEDLIPLLIRFRSYPFAISADIAKFFNQFMIQDDHKDFHRLIYRSSPHLLLQHYRMTRVTFGVTASPFLATRTLWKIFEDERSDEDLTRVIKDDILVDNVLTGGFFLTEVLNLQKKLIGTMTKGKLVLRKWASNIPQIIEAVPPEHRECQLLLTISKNSKLHTLGLKWDPAPDCFAVIIPEIESVSESVLTKRLVLSQEAKLFDPLGWLSPVSIRAKIYLQDLWRSKLDWDSPLTPKLRIKWTQYAEDIKSLHLFRNDWCYAPITIHTSQDPLRYQLIGFSDASNDAYAAVAYIRTIDPSGQIIISLVGAKTKVSPIKGETTPRSELNGARLLFTFLKTILASSRLHFEVTVCYADSTSVLGWTTQSSLRLSRKDIFVLNRVRTIKENVPSAQWFHVKGEENPADIASRGISSSSFLKNPIWQKGPPWLSTIDFPVKIIDIFTASTASSILFALINKFSSLTRMSRVVAFILRFLNNAKTQQRRTGPLTSSELDSALSLIIITIQKEEFGEEIHLLSKGLPLTKKIKFLSPFLNNVGLVRVGGRLSNSDMKEEAKHSILLPKNHHFTQVLFRSLHLRHHHAGPTLLLTLIREKYWIPSGPSLARKIVRSCVPCHRQVARPLTQIMPDLPTPRVSLTRPVTHVGMDFAGPFILAVTTGRKPRLTKSYICVFVCMGTKAVHLELVGDLSTPSFLASLRRLVSRRGRPQHLYSDGGKNFVGGRNELDKVVQFLNSEELKDGAGVYSSENEIVFNFNPPLSPHHGGLWEAVVKSTKHHLKRVVEDRHLSHEEFGTLLCVVEALLNSRPLTPMSLDPSDFQALTPAHFLIGGSLFSVPQTDATTTNENQLSRWEKGQQIFQNFWKRFTTEYLQTLLNRPKWLQNQPNVEPGVLVLVQEPSPNFLAHNWNLARVTQVFPGPDGRVRVVEVRTPSGSLLRRPIVRISPLGSFLQTKPGWKIVSFEW